MGFGTLDLVLWDNFILAVSAALEDDVPLPPLAQALVVGILPQDSVGAGCVVGILPQDHLAITVAGIKSVCLDHGL